MTRVRAAVVGLGWMGMLHASAYADHPQVELVGLVEADPSRREALREQFAVPVSDDVDSVLDAADVVSVCTPDDRHVAATERALEAGARVLVEKPLATTVADAERILAARPTPKALMVGQLLRFDPRVRRARQQFRAGAIGELWHAEVWRRTSRDVAATPAMRTSVGWFLGIHDVDALRYLTGLDVVEVFARARSCWSRHWDVVHASLELTGGVLAQLNQAWTLPPARPSRAEAGVRLIGSAGAIECDLGHHDLLLVTDTAVQLDTYNWPGGDGQPANIHREVDAFVQAALDDAVPPISGEDGLAAVEVVARIEAAAAASSNGADARGGLDQLAEDGG